MINIKASQNDLNTLLKDMQQIAERMRELILKAPPQVLLGYLLWQLALAQKTPPEQNQEFISYNSLDEIQFLFEYVHAVWASEAGFKCTEFNETDCNELAKLSSELLQKAFEFSMLSSWNSSNNDFGPQTQDLEFFAKSSWLIIRGHRYFALEEEFYRYVLAPHDGALKEVYGIDAANIAKEMQSISNSLHFGLNQAAYTLFDQMTSTKECTSEHELTREDAIEDLLFGGVFNISRHTKLPATLLGDLSYQRGEDKDFFAEGKYMGTPFRTLPIRKKPLIKLDGDYYAVDFCFIRDAGHRALLFNLLQRKPDYQLLFKEKQKNLTEKAFADILAEQLPDAKILHEVYYKDTKTNQWCENDLLILLDDVLILVEAKAGAAASIASPELDFQRHVQSVKDLIIKAYHQCERFFNYLNSAHDVPLYQKIDGKYKECCRIRLSDFRVMLPIGLTIESFAPFSTFCKNLPQLNPLLGKHAFISLSIDDLFVLKRFLPTPGEFFHYMQVRQTMSRIRHVYLFDEFDHLGAYLQNNRFDLNVIHQLHSGKQDWIVANHMSDLIDKTFEGEDWENSPFYKQPLPEEVLNILKALDSTRAKGWLEIESFIRDFNDDGSETLATMLLAHRQTLKNFEFRYFSLGTECEQLFIWLQQDVAKIDWTRINDKASATALCCESSKKLGLLITVSADGTYLQALPFRVDVPTKRTQQNEHIFKDAENMLSSRRKIMFTSNEDGK